MPVDRVRGRAVAGGVGVGLFKDFGMAERLAPLLDTTDPNPSAASVYDDLYALFNRAYEALAPVYDDLAAF